MNPLPNLRTSLATPLRFRLFYHSIISDWNNGHAHFLRGYVAELQARGHDVVVYEPEGAWSVENLLREEGREAIAAFHARFPDIRVERYGHHLEVADIAAEADIVIVHEWNPPDLIAAFGHARSQNSGFCLLFHDTHHRAATDPAAMGAYDLRHYDGVLAFGNVLRDLYLDRGWTRRAWTWHEAADTRIFRPQHSPDVDLDLIWIGNWGDDERSSELLEFLIGPVERLGLKALIHGVRYPEEALASLRSAGITYGGRLPNEDAPHAFARAKVTVHVPRRPYAKSLPGIPTIRPFEAMACGIPLVSGPWTDSEHLFEPGRDFLFARNGREMESHLRRILSDRSLSGRLTDHALRTIRTRHSCAQRVDELLAICEALMEATIL